MPTIFVSNAYQDNGFVMDDIRFSAMEDKLDRILDNLTDVKVTSAQLSIEMKNVQNNGCSKKEDIDKSISKLSNRMSYTQGGFAILSAIWLWLAGGWKP
jgi:hypothetical protein